jgi:N-acyl-phosphatidylethanolamine-hydrolysing phospholipase D
MIPIGAYDPRWFMKPMHVMPEESVQIHLDVQSRLSVACHWGTFCLTDEPMDEPPKRLRAELARRAISPDTFRVLSIGETVAF